MPFTNLTQLLYAAHMRGVYYECGIISKGRELEDPKMIGKKKFAAIGLTVAFLYMQLLPHMFTKPFLPKKAG